MQVSQSIKQDDAEMMKLLKAREGMPNTKLKFDNIFDAVVNSKEEAKRLQEESDELIKDRDVNELNGLFSKLRNPNKQSAFGILNHIKTNQNIDNET